MAQTFEISDVLADAAREANVPPFAADTNVTLAQATHWMIQGARSLSARLRQSFGDDGDFLKVTTLTTIPSLNFISLPEQAGEIRSVVWARTSSDYRLLRPGNMEEVELLADGDLRAWRDDVTPTYRLEGETLSFYPASSEAESIVLFYTDHLDLTGQDHFPARLDADRWLVLDLAIRVVRAQGRDPALLIQDKLLLETHLFAPARQRMPARINTIRDVRGAEEVRTLRSRWSR